MVDEKKDEQEKYGFDHVPVKKKTIDETVEEELIKLEQKWKEIEDVHILDVAKEPPEKDYMRVELRKAELKTKDEDGKPVKTGVLALPLGEKPIIKDNTVFRNYLGDEVQIYDTIFDVDLKQMAEAQISDCASTIFPMLLDEYVQLALDEKKARQPEKRKEEFKWWWVIILIMIIIPILLITFTVLPGLLGGG